jgi:hypothetical protein
MPDGFFIRLQEFRRLQCNGIHGIVGVLGSLQTLHYELPRPRRSQQASQ